MTLSDSDYRINADGYAVAHSSAFVNDSHQRIETSVTGPLYAAAYRNEKQTVTVIQVKKNHTLSLKSLDQRIVYLPSQLRTLKYVFIIIYLVR